MGSIGSTWIPFPKDGDADKNFSAAVVQVNDNFNRPGILVINIETVTRLSWLGLVETRIGLRVWWRDNRHA